LRSHRRKSKCGIQFSAQCAGLQQCPVCRAATAPRLQGCSSAQFTGLKQRPFLRAETAPSLQGCNSAHCSRARVGTTPVARTESTDVAVVGSNVAPLQWLSFQWILAISLPFLVMCDCPIKVDWAAQPMNPFQTILALSGVPHQPGIISTCHCHDSCGMTHESWQVLGPGLIKANLQFSMMPEL